MKYSLALCILLLTACATTGQPQTAMPSPEMVITATPAITSTAEPATITDATEVPAPTMVTEPCAFVEGTQNLPEVSAQLDKAVKELQPTAVGRAQTYGENCLDTSSGQSTFQAMETDFYFKINVKKLNDNNELGMWIVKVMKIVNNVHPASLPGPQAGFVDFTFNMGSDQRILHVPINQYKELPTDIDPSDLIPTLVPNP